MLGELLQRATAMPVHEVGDAVRAPADRVCVFPPHAGISVAGGVFHLAPPSEPRGPQLPIDVLSGSLARDPHKSAGTLGRTRRRPPRRRARAR